MKIALNGLLLAVFSLLAFQSIGQEEDKIPMEKAIKADKKVDGLKPPNLKPSMKRASTPPSKLQNSRKGQEKEKKLYAENKKLKREIVFETGDWIKFELKEDKGKIKGKIEKIEPGKITLDEKEYLLRDIISVTPKLFSQFGNRAKGFAQIGLGAPIIALGGGIIYYSYTLVDPNSPIVIAAALGATIGAGVVLYGVSFWHKGGKLVFAPRKLKSDKSWRFRAR